MAAIQIFVIFFLGFIVFLLKQIRVSFLHYQRPKLFPPGPSQVCLPKIVYLLKNILPELENNAS